MKSNGFKVIDSAFGYERYYNDETKVTIDFSGISFYVLKGSNIHFLLSVQDLADLYRERDIVKEIKINLEK